MKKDLISIEDLNKQKLVQYLNLAAKMESLPDAEKRTMLAGKILAVLFFEPSTRTRLSFEAAMQRLGGSVIGFSESNGSSISKGETVKDTICTVENYSDAIAIRHPKEGTARLAAEASRIPVINGGDGANQHPTQTLLDLYTIQKIRGKFDGLNIAMAGDLKYSRTIHSLFQALAKFDNVHVHLVSPESLKLPAHIKQSIEGRTITWHEDGNFVDSVKTCDILYMTRIQRERFPDALEYEKVKDSFCVDRSLLKHAQPHLKILHPLPRVNEIHPDVDSTPFAGYFEQVRNGLIMRQAILFHLIGGSNK